MRAEGPALPRRAVFAGGGRGPDRLDIPAPAGRSRSRARQRFAAAGGYARLVLKFAEDVGSEVTTAGSILVIRFKRPVDIPIEKLSDAVPDYVGSARRDPDGSAIRLSLARRVTINTMTAGERVFVDLLPDTGTVRLRPFRSRWSANWPSARESPSAHCASSARQQKRRSARRSACAHRCSRPSSVSCLKCPTALASRPC